MLLGKTAKVGYFRPIINDVKKGKKDNHINTIISHFQLDINPEEAYAFTRSEFIKKRNKGKEGEIFDKIIEKYIDNNNLKYFNNVLIVRAAPHHEKFKIFDDLDLNHSSETGDNFITHTCLYSNTLHFNGGSLPDLAAHTIPIISKQFIN